MSLSAALDRRLHNLHKWLVQQVTEQEQLLLALYDENNYLKDQLGIEDEHSRVPKAGGSSLSIGSHHGSFVGFMYESESPAVTVVDQGSLLVNQVPSKSALKKQMVDREANGLSGLAGEAIVHQDLGHADTSFMANGGAFQDSGDLCTETTIEDDVPLPPTLPKATPQAKMKRPELSPAVQEAPAESAYDIVEASDEFNMVPGDHAEKPSQTRLEIGPRTSQESSNTQVTSVSKTFSVSNVSAIQRARAAARPSKYESEKSEQRLSQMMQDLRRSRPVSVIQQSSMMTSRMSTRASGRPMGATLSSGMTMRSSGLARGSRNSAGAVSRGRKSEVLYEPWPAWIDARDCCDGDASMPSSPPVPHMLDDTKFLNLVKEIEGRGEKPWHVISPMSRFCIFWDSLFMFLIGYDFVMVPLQAFDIEENAILTGMGWMTRLFWTISMPLQCCTGFIDRSGNIEVRPQIILRRYLTTWLWLDIVVVGSDWAMLIIGGLDMVGSVNIVKVMRILRVIRVLRMARVFKLPSLLESINTRTYFEKARLVVEIVKITVVIIGIAHCIACLWYAVGGGDNSWIDKYNFHEQPLGYRYAMSLHWSLSQLHGTMEVTPCNELERWFALFVLAFCFLASAAFVSQITAFLTRLSIISGHQGRMNAVLRQFLEYNNISTSLSLRVTRSANYVLAQYEKNMPEGDVELLGMIPQPLLVEIHYEVNVPILTAHPFFRRYHHVCPVAVKKICHSAVSKVSLSVGDLLFTEGERPAKPQMFFITSGMCIYMKHSLSDVWQVKVGGWACEMCMWTPWTHQGSMRAGTHSNILSLDVEGYQHIVSAFHDPVFYPGQYGREVVRQLNGGYLSDVDWDDLDPLAYPNRPEVDDVNYGSLDIAAIVSKVFPQQLLRSSAGGVKKSSRNFSMRSSNSSARSGRSSAEGTGSASVYGDSVVTTPSLRLFKHLVSSKSSEPPSVNSVVKTPAESVPEWSHSNRSGEEHKVEESRELVDAGDLSRSVTLCASPKETSTVTALLQKAKTSMVGLGALRNSHVIENKHDNQSHHHDHGDHNGHHSHDHHDVHL